MNNLLVLDFDGTITDAEAEGVPFRSGYLEDIAHLAGLSLAEVEPLALSFQEEVSQNPNAHGWLFNGHIVAPASVDPYLRMMPVARKILDHAGVFLNEVDRTRLLDGILYKYNYPKTNVVFKDGAYECLRGLEGTHTWVVTNSHTVPVQKKIQSLGEAADGPDLGWLVARVHGRAQKYVLDDTFTAVPETLQLPGLERPVLLRRKLYHDALVKLLKQADASWSDLLVVGDIFELDLALPLAMGARVGLVSNRFTPAYEREYVEGHARGTMVETLSEIHALFNA